MSNTTDNQDKVYQESKVGSRTIWEEAVPLPYYSSNWLLQNRYKCHCGQKFKKESDYEHHYRKEHINE